MKYENEDNQKTKNNHPKRNKQAIRKKRTTLNTTLKTRN